MQPFCNLFVSERLFEFETKTKKKAFVTYVTYFFKSLEK
jgi:hypothetical protein